MRSCSSFFLSGLSQADAKRRGSVFDTAKLVIGKSAAQVFDVQEEKIRLNHVARAVPMHDVELTPLPQPLHVGAGDVDFSR
jgi:hypothetical protein